VTYPSTHLFNKAFEYTPAKAMGPNYLSEKFARIRQQQIEKTTVVTLKRKVK